MANVKRRLKAPKSAPKNQIKRKMDRRTKKARKSLRAVIEIESAYKRDVDSNEVDSGIVRKRTANNDMLFLTPEEKVQYLLQNGHLLKDHYDPNTKKSDSDSMSSAKFDLSSPLRTKSGRLKSSKYKYLNIMDNILKCEFGMIPGKHKNSDSAESSTNGVNNNNDSDITNQNSKEKNNKTNKKKCERNKSSNQINKAPSQIKENLNLDSPDLNVMPVSEKVSDRRRYSKRLSVQAKCAPELETPQTTPEKCQPKANPKNNQRTKSSKQVALANGIIFKLNIFVCDYCQKAFNRKHSLVRHIYIHVGNKPYTCPVCPKKFRVRKNMKIHVDRDHCVNIVDDGAETYPCEICDKPFLSEESLRLHITSHAKGENSFKCIYCDKKFAYQLLLVQHEKQHLVTGKYQCTICDMKYNSRDKLYGHVKSHLKLTDYICQYCGREFLRANSMKRHIQIMHVGRTIQCPICKKKLKGHLTEHMRTHDKHRPHQCPDCGKLFAQSTQMQVHRRGHTGSRPYFCRICERPFSHSNALMLHHRRHTGEKPFPCAECPLSFSQLPHMKAHMNKIHGKENPYKCLKCQDYFKLKKELFIHKKTCTGTGIDTDLYGDNKLSEDSPQEEDGELMPLESTMTLPRMRFLLALLLTMIASKEKLKYLGFNKRLVDDLLIESLEAMDQAPCKDDYMTPLVRLRTNIEMLLNVTVPKEQMEKFRKENKSTEELLELLTSEKEK